MKILLLVIVKQFIKIIQAEEKILSEEEFKKYIKHAIDTINSSIAEEKINEFLLSRDWYFDYVNMKDKSDNNFIYYLYNCFLKYFSEYVPPNYKMRFKRSNILEIGAFLPAYIFFTQNTLHILKIQILTINNLIKNPILIYNNYNKDIIISIIFKTMQNLRPEGTHKDYIDLIIPAVVFMSTVSWKAIKWVASLLLHKDLR